MIAGAEHCGPGGCKLRIAGVSKVFDGRRGKVVALEGINLNIRGGEFVCLVGASGCGKTSLLNIIAGLEFPSSGVVELDGEILGKPHSREEAVSMISRLSGRSHTVCTGVTVITAEETRTFHETTEVHFYLLSPQEVEWYCSLKEPYDKAGAYGIQAAGALLVQGLTGDYFNVMGLPVAALARHLREMGVTAALSEN